MNDNELLELQDFLDITLPELLKNNEPNIEGENQVIAFLGAGLSTNYGCKSWNELASNLLNECYKQDKINYLTLTSLQNRCGDAKIIISIAKKLLCSENNDCFIQCVKSSLNHSDDMYTTNGWKPANDEWINDPIYDYLQNLGFYCYFTTNADRHIDTLHKNKEEKILIDSFNATVKLKERSLYKIHGCVSKPESMIFTSEEYVKAYKQDGHLGSFLDSIFLQHTVVFIGYGLAEFEILERLLSNKANKNKYHYIINNYFQHDLSLIQAYESYFNSLGVKQVINYLDDIGYKNLNTIFKSRSELIANKNKPLEKYDIIDNALMEI